MNVKIIVAPSEELREFLQRGRNLPALMLQAVGKGLAAAGPIIVGNAVKDRFTALQGPFPIAQHKLGRVTGRLRQSITNTKPRINTAGSEVTMGFGSNVRYFAVHEFGFTGEIKVEAHRRKAYTVNRAQQNRTSRSGKAFTVRGNSFSVLPGMVRAHTRKMNMPAREPMQTELRDARTTKEVISQVTRRVILALEEGGPA